MKIDKNDFVFMPDTGHTVQYSLYYDKTNGVSPPDKTKKTLKNTNYACFAHLPQELNCAQNKYNRIMYVIQKKNLKLTHAEGLAWIELAIKNKTLPLYINEAMLKSGKFIIKLTDDLSPSLVYIYLTSIRVLQEHISFAKNMLTLVNKYDVDFCAAWIMASRISFGNCGHNIVRISKEYGTLDLTNVSAEVRYAIGLKRYLKNPAKYDKRSIYDMKRFLSSDTIYHINTSNIRITIADILHPAMKKAVNTKKDTSATKWLAQIKQ